MLGWIAIFAPLGLLLLVSFRAAQMSTAAVQAVYWTVTALMGVSLSLLLFRYTGASVARTFFVTAAAFGALSLYGYTTKRDLTAMGKFLFMGVIGLILAGIVNMIWPSGTMSFIISAAGVLIFSGLIAYDTQRIKEQYSEAWGTDMVEKVADLRRAQPLPGLREPVPVPDELHGSVARLADRTFQRNRKDARVERPGRSLWGECRRRQDCAPRMPPYTFGMRRTSYEQMNCSIASALDVVGEPWTLLIVRDAFYGVRRFDDFQENLGIARNVLTARLKKLVEAGIFRKTAYRQRPLRHEYRLTEKGAALFTVIVGLKQWGDRFGAAARGGRPMDLVDRADNRAARPGADRCRKRPASRAHQRARRGGTRRRREHAHLLRSPGDQPTGSLGRRAELSPPSGRILRAMSGSAEERTTRLSPSPAPDACRRACARYAPPRPCPRPSARACGRSGGG